MADFSIIWEVVLQWMSTGFFWIVVVLGFLVLAVGIIFYRRWRTLKFTAFEFTVLESGNLVIEKSKAGWFGRKKFLRGWIDWGRVKQMKLKDKRIVHEFSVEDYHEFNGKRCILVTSHPEDKSMVVPISKVSIDEESLDMLYQIAPADYREAAVREFEQATNEMKSKLERYLPYILLGGLVIFFIIGLLINNQITAKSIDSAKSILSQASGTLENIADKLVSYKSGAAP
jgi:hypothetical protein